VSLTAKDVEEITRLLEDSAFDELHLEINGVKLSVRRGAAAGEPVAALRSAGATQLKAPAATVASAAVAPAPASPDPDAVDISAPLLGTFYRAPKPGAAPFVDIGTRVEADTIIGIIEVMKLMNTVRAGVRGSVVQILGRDGVLVEYGETLMRVRPAE